MADFQGWPGNCLILDMLRILKRPFVIRTRIEACFIIYALALGASERGKDYLSTFPGHIGQIMYGACMLAVLMAGAKIMDGINAQKD